MVNINIEIPDELHKKLKLDSVKNDTSLKDNIVKLLENAMKGVR